MQKEEIEQEMGDTKAALQQQLYTFGGRVKGKPVKNGSIVFSVRLHEWIQFRLHKGD